ncbi:MAG: hypothetical protein CVU55_14850 [Deltaproteobacteria bacterium HGW-Deltaproteobacteria-13]|nr:MAG: hypothetical protein CVU55_14850 [Deltaproteobacteria bacterium HGW-Deltaproteobacteria-13]
MKMNRILVVDDREENRYLLNTLLHGNGYEVVTASHGAEALDLARQNPPDLIISDILMPVMDGFTLCREWKKDERLKSIPFIFYTATYTDERDRRFALSLGAERFILKPEESDVFMTIIRETLQQAGNIAVTQTTPGANNSSPLPPEAAEKDDSVYLKQYNEVLIRKLEAKMEQLERINSELSKDITARKQAEDELSRLNRELGQRVIERTAELNAVIDRLEELNRVFVGREMKMAELKERIAELEKKENVKSEA